MDEKAGKSKKSHCKVWIWPTIVLSIGVLAIVLVFFLGFVKTSTSQQSGGAGIVVCNTETVSSYNDLMEYKMRGDSVEPYVDKDGIKNLAAEIKSINGYDNDPTCQTMIFWAAFLDKDYDGAKNAYEAVKRLHGQRIFADSNIHSNAPLFTYESTLYTIAPSNGETKDGLGQ